MKLYNCLNCNKEFESKKGCKTRQPKYCSKQCYANSLKININCKLCNNIIENKHSAKISNRIYCSKDCQSKARINIKLPESWKKSLSNGRKKSNKCKGENLYNWKGGKETLKQRVSIYSNNRRSAQKIKIDKDYLNKIINAQDYKCFYCENDLHNYKAIEHLIPLSRGGDNYKNNLVYSCKSCNSKKRNKTLKEYAIKNNMQHLILKQEYLYASAIS